MLSQNTVALCDVDFGYVEKALLEQAKPPQPITAPPNISAADAPAWIARRTAAAQARYQNGQKQQEL